MNKFKKALSLFTAAALSVTAFAGLAVTAGAAASALPYERGTTTAAWSNDDLTDWELNEKGPESAKPTINADHGLCVVNTSTGAVTKSLTLSDKAIVTYKADIYINGSPGINKARTSFNYVYLKFGSNVTIGYNGDYKFFYSTNGGSSYESQELTGQRKATTTAIEAVINTSSNKLVSLSVNDTNVSEAANTVLDSSATYNSVSMGFTRNTSVSWDVTYALENIKVTEEVDTTKYYDVTCSVTNPRTNEKKDTVYSIEAGKKLTQLPDTDIYGYVLDNWYIGEDTNNTISSADILDAAVNNDIKYTAVYSEDASVARHNISYVIDGNTVQEDLLFGTEKITSIPNSFKEGYYFEGWQKNSETGVLSDSDLKALDLPAGTTTFTAKYHELAKDISLGAGTIAEPYVNYGFSGDTNIDADVNKIVGGTVVSNKVYSNDEWLTYHVGHYAAIAKDARNCGTFTIRKDGFAYITATSFADADTANGRAPRLILNKYPQLSDITSGNVMYYVFDFKLSSAAGAIYLNNGNANAPSGDFIKLSLANLSTDTWYTVFAEVDPSQSKVTARIKDSNGILVNTQTTNYEATGDPCSIRFLGTANYSIDNIKIYQAVPSVASESASVVGVYTGDDENALEEYETVTIPENDADKAKVATAVKATFAVGANASYAHPNISWEITYTAEENGVGTVKRTKDMAYSAALEGGESGKSETFGAVFTGVNLKNFDYSKNPTVTAILTEGE